MPAAAIRSMFAVITSEPPNDRPEYLRLSAKTTTKFGALAAAAAPSRSAAVGGQAEAAAAAAAAAMSSARRLRASSNPATCELRERGSRFYIQQARAAASSVSHERASTCSLHRPYDKSHYTHGDLAMQIVHADAKVSISSCCHAAPSGPRGCTASGTAFRSTDWKYLANHRRTSAVCP